MFGFKTKITVEQAAQAVTSWSSTNVSAVLPDILPDLNELANNFFDDENNVSKLQEELVCASFGGLCHVLKNKVSPEIGEAVWEQVKLHLMKEFDNETTVKILEYYGRFGFPFAPEDKIIENLGISEVLDFAFLEMFKFQLSYCLTELVSGPWEKITSKYAITKLLALLACSILRSSSRRYLRYAFDEDYRDNFLNLRTRYSNR